MQEKRIKSLKLPEPLTSWSQGRGARNTGTSRNRLHRAAPRKLRAGWSLSRGSGLPCEASGGDRKGMVTPIVHPWGLVPASLQPTSPTPKTVGRGWSQRGGWSQRSGTSRDSTSGNPRSRASQSVQGTPTVATREDKVQIPRSGSPTRSPSYPSTLGSTTQPPSAACSCRPPSTLPLLCCLSHPARPSPTPRSSPNTHTSCLPKLLCPSRLFSNASFPQSLPWSLHPPAISLKSEAPPPAHHRALAGTLHPLHPAVIAIPLHQLSRQGCLGLTPQRAVVPGVSCVGLGTFHNPFESLFFPICKIRTLTAPNS